LDLADVSCCTVTGTGRNGDPAFLTLALGWPSSREYAALLGMDERGVEVLDAVFGDPASHLVAMTLFSVCGRRLR
jgi:hypothetical protein